ncbi:YbeD family protein [Nitrosomonas sp. PY1]|uniref:HP0495 family protein n=1 Tax=Nitrosomonas sp. PY1 TaxID=1803906 RepID=UPI001FC7DB46|nr:DUF493 domain-containing protein [Nitrosomonas sp. PY1]
MEETSLIEYPSDFPIKIMGKSHDHLVQTVVDIVKRHAPDFDETAMLTTRSSKHGTYLSITCTIRATSRPQLDALYQALSNHPMISVVL